MTIDIAYQDVVDPPFNHEDADLIVRSTSSNVDFRVMKAFLIFASLRWKDMLTTYSQNAVKDIKDGLHILPLEEDEETLGTLLRLCYPPHAASTMPKITTVQHAAAIFDVARKYLAEVVETVIMQQVMGNFLCTEPMRVFAFAWRFGMCSEMKLAAKETLRLPLLGREYSEELEWISGGALHRLQQYHVACGQAAGAVVDDLVWLTRETFTWFECMDCNRRECATVQVKISGNRMKWVYSKWWQEYMKAMKSALNACPSRRTVEDPILVEEALRKACQSCLRCGMRVFKEMREFCQMLADAVDKATEKVILNIQL
ncbi:hypothetical protein Moror_16249 [Moniliophthora roreri MCA 2997]|uniref:BTB domain-containing protein n=1 Tax=Moniliophthora roreri (strain MCA 2997) TaxID=1381753 RepID=V2X950_MONRO|nr:hypothetical protein Moror_16249 [Moniliophthora roreri MCA 2997]